LVKNPKHKRPEEDRVWAETFTVSAPVLVSANWQLNTPLVRRIFYHLVKHMRAMVLFLAGALVPASAADDVSARRQLHPVPIQQVTVNDAFWTPKRDVWQRVTIIDAFTKFENDRGGALNNFDRVRDGLKGNHAGPPWYDGLIYEMIRGSSDFLAAHPDPELDRRLDGYILRIAAAAAKDPNGYVNTYTQLDEPGHQWGLHGGFLLWQHEVYNAGALVEAAVHHYRATGKTSLLNVAVKFANYMAELMGTPPKKNIVPAHPLPEEALVKLYLLFRQEPQLKAKVASPVNEAAYLRLAEFWIENRGVHAGAPDWTDQKKAEEWVRAEKYGDSRPSWGAYSSDDGPALRQSTIKGHAVRASLLWTGVAAAASVNQRDDYKSAAERVWTNLTERRMHITGGTGAFAKDEAFGADYQLPNDAYLETCAAVAAGFFHRNMGLLEGQARYFDELERVLYNGALGGVSLKGDTYFYENPLVAGMDRARWPWHDCPCCPPMFLKMMGAMPGYIYATDDSGLYVNLFVGSRATAGVGEKKVSLSQSTRYPWEGYVEIRLESDTPADFPLYVRIPGWSKSVNLKLNGQTLADWTKVRGYALLRRTWKKGDTLEVLFPMPVERIRSHPSVANNAGRVALMRGPIVYALESVDQAEPVRFLSFPQDARLEPEFRPDLLGGVTVIQGTALTQSSDWSGLLYTPFDRLPAPKTTTFTAIPYYTNANRGPVDMLVWVPETVEAHPRN